MGFCFVAGSPETPEATEALLNRIGPIRNTHYGAFWDFTSNLASKDTAYTSEGLDVHTDTNYFTDPARYVPLFSHSYTPSTLTNLTLTLTDSNSSTSSDTTAQAANPN